MPKKNSSPSLDTEEEEEEAQLPLRGSSNYNEYDVIEGIDPDGWFTETEALWPGQKFSLALEEFSTQQSILFYQESEFQSILVFKSAQYGNVLVLDGVIQLTARDEFAYHEMMVHLPMCSLPSTINTGIHVLIVGGGDGGVLREVVTHYDASIVQSITMVEIDPMVVEVAKEYFGVGPYFADERVTVIHADAAEYLRQQQQNDDDDNNNNRSSTRTRRKYHVIIGDTSDPVGPAQSLFEPAFYESMYQALDPIAGGIVCVQAECFWIHLELISDLITCCRDIFDTAEYATTLVPTYPCGQIGFILATSRGQQSRQRRTSSCRIPVRRPGRMDKLRWYSPQVHQAAFVLPPFVMEKLRDTSATVTASKGLFLTDVNGQDDDRGIQQNEQDNDNDDSYNCFLDDCFSRRARVVQNGALQTAWSGNGEARDEGDENTEDKECFFLGDPSQCTIL